MKTSFLAVAILALSGSIALAAEDSNLSTKAMQDQPGNTGGGTTSNATAKPNSGSLSEKQMQGQPGVNSDKTGNTSMPNAKPQDGSLAGEEMNQNQGAHK
jgi:hypothetical protein